MGVALIIMFAALALLALLPLLAIFRIFPDISFYVLRLVVCVGTLMIAFGKKDTITAVGRVGACLITLRVIVLIIINLYVRFVVGGYDFYESYHTLIWIDLALLSVYIIAFVLMFWGLRISTAVKCLGLLPLFGNMAIFVISTKIQSYFYDYDFVSDDAWDKIALMKTCSGVIGCVQAALFIAAIVCVILWMRRPTASRKSHTL